jgi:hypothetical protein
MNKYIMTISAVLFMIATTAASANTMLSYAQNTSNMTTDDVGKLAPDGSATGIIAQGEKSFIVVCPEDFQTIKQCQILVTQPTVVAVK